MCSSSCHCSYFLLHIYLWFSHLILYSINSTVIPSFPLWRVLLKWVPLAMENDQRYHNIGKQGILIFLLVSFIHIHHCELTELENAMVFVSFRVLCRILMAFSSQRDWGWLVVLQNLMAQRLSALLARTALCPALIPAGGCRRAGLILAGPKACCGAHHVSPRYLSAPYSPNIVQMHWPAFPYFPYSLSWSFLTESLWSKRGWSRQHSR